jgi:hypothetical protein
MKLIGQQVGIIIFLHVMLEEGIVEGGVLLYAGYKTEITAYTVCTK